MREYPMSEMSRSVCEISISSITNYITAVPLLRLCARTRKLTVDKSTRMSARMLTAACQNMPIRTRVRRNKMQCIHLT